MRTIALALALGLSNNAYALSCLWGVHDTNINDATDVPTNGRVLIKHTFDDTADIAVMLTDASGAEVPFTLEKGHNHAYLVPDAPLAANTTYTLTSTDDEGWLDATFTTADADDTEAPEVPTLRSLDREFDKSEWGDTRGVRAIADEVWDAAHYEFEIATDADFTDAARVASLRPEALLGIGLCESAVPDYDHAERYHVRVRAVDFAGNASDWQTSDGAVTGCSSIGTASLALGLPAALVALFGRRRRF